MTSPQRGRRRGLIWAVVGAVVVLVAIAAAIITSTLSGPTAPEPSASADSSPSADPTTAATGEFVDETVVAKGWVPEPITTDAESYIRAALAAASTFDTQKGSRSDWLAYLDTWFTPDTRYTSEQDRQDDMRASQLEMRQGVVLPEEEWSSLTDENGRVEAAVNGEIAYSDVPDDSSGDMTIGTADVILTYTRADDAGNESSYTDKVRVSVQVLCGRGSVPTPHSGQQPGDCKVVRYFSGSLEP